MKCSVLICGFLISTAATAQTIVQQENPIGTDGKCTQAVLDGRWKIINLQAEQIKFLMLDMQKMMRGIRPASKVETNRYKQAIIDEGDLHKAKYGNYSCQDSSGQVMSGVEVYSIVDDYRKRLE